MSGFKNDVLNRAIAQRLLKYILSKILVCCELMLEDCKNKKIVLSNLENVIRDHLFTEYLNSDDIMEQVGLEEFRFFPEVPENYQGGKPEGRTDLQVFSMDMFKYRKRYFTIECKRIDGSKTLNRYYVKNGIRRFVLPNPLYPSAYSTNCMFGFVVKDVDIEESVEEINSLQLNEYSDINVKSPISFTHISDINKYSYESEYTVVNAPDILLYHIFYDFSLVIDNS